MAGDRHGKHNTTTISFRVNSYEKATIEEVRFASSQSIQSLFPDPALLDNSQPYSCHS